MKATRIRYKDGTKATERFLRDVCEHIIASAAASGFITDAEVLSENSIKIGLHMRSFRVDTLKLGHNARLNGRWGKSPKGYKRTDVPTWDQRVEFNNLVNRIFNANGLQANITSGNYTVRTAKGGAVKSWPEGGDRSANVGFSGTCSTEIYTESEAREYAKSDELEKQHRENQKIVRRDWARAYRAHVKTLQACAFVTFKCWKSTPQGYRNVRFVETLEHAKKLGIKLTDCQPAPGDSREDALKVLRVMERLNGKE